IGDFQKPLEFTTLFLHKFQILNPLSDTMIDRISVILVKFIPGHDLRLPFYSFRYGISIPDNMNKISRLEFLYKKWNSSNIGNGLFDKRFSAMRIEVGPVLFHPPRICQFQKGSVHSHFTPPPQPSPTQTLGLCQLLSEHHPVVWK